MNSSILKLENLREKLIRQEETIIFALIERAQWAQNEAIYTPGAISVPSSYTGFSFLDYFFLETERVHAYCRRYSSPDEHPFFPNKIPPPILPLLDFPEIIKPNVINLNQKIKQIYLTKIIPAICKEKDDSQYGSASSSDVQVLQALSKRIHYGKFVAEAKFQASPKDYEALIEAGDADAIMKKLTDTKVEEKLLERVRLKASTYGKEISVQTPVSDVKLEPEIIVQLYKDFIIPLTKEVQVLYLLDRLAGSTVAYLGPEGTFSHQVALKHFQKLTACGEKINYMSCENIKEVFFNIMSAKASFAVIPIENSQTGVVQDHLNLIIQHDVKVCAELYFPIQFALLSKSESIHKLKIIYSHPQGFLQCQSWLKLNIPTATLVPVASTALGAKEALKDETVGVLGSIAISTKFGLPILNPNVQDVVDNKTRFFITSKIIGEPCGKDKTIITFGLQHKAGALSSVLSVFGKNGINLNCITSFPDKKAASYGFFVEFDGHMKDKHVCEALSEIKAFTTFLNIKGSFPAADPNEI